MAAGKLAVFAALMAAVIAVASATTYTTVVTTVMEDENQSCQQEYQQQGRLNHCMRWMQERIQGRGPREESFLRSAVANPARFGEEHQNQCCDQLQRISNQCTCQALRMMMEEMQQSFGQMEQQRMEQMRRMVEEIPERCGMQMQSRCPMRAIFV